MMWPFHQKRSSVAIKKQDQERKDRERLDALKTDALMRELKQAIKGLSPNKEARRD